MLAVIPVTIHLPLRDVPNALTKELIVESGRIAARDYRARFGIANPRLAVCGLNPHAGEEGTIGREDIEIVTPPCTRFAPKASKRAVRIPPTVCFHEGARKYYDVALGMYHDQVLAPVKALAFDRAVNVTLGLPFVRTSPDHGTAFNIAGSGTGNPSSLEAAIKLAARLSQQRMSAIDGLPPLRDVIRRHELNAKKSLGQNFLLDLNLTSRIARAGGSLDGITVIEVGAGPGGLTRALLAEGAEKVIAIERDRRCIAALEEVSAHYPGKLRDRRSRCARIRSRSAHCRQARADRCQPSLQYRDAPPGELADARAVAAVLRFAHSDVSARSRPAHHRERGRRRLWAAFGACRLAFRSADFVRCESRAHSCRRRKSHHRSCILSRTRNRFSATRKY